MPHHDEVVVLPRPRRPAPLPVGSVQGTLALDLAPREAPPEPFPPPPAPRGDEVDAAVRRSLSGWAHRYGQAVVEIVGGDRPPSQLVRWTTREVYLDLHRRAWLVAQAGGHDVGVARVQPVRPRVVGVHLCFVTERVVEAGLHVRYGERSRALAARFEIRRGRWICTALQFA